MRRSDIESRYVTSFLSRRFARPFIYSLILALMGFSLASAYYSARAASTYVVVNVLDTGGACLPVPIPGCTLRQALTTAVTGDLITFAIPGVGPFTIMPASSLPTIIQGITIDGTTQPGASCGPAFNLLIVIDGTSAPAGTIGLSFAAGSQGSIVKGIVVDNFTNDGIVFQNSGSNTLTCSMIGTDATGGIAQPNTGNGISILSGTLTTIGGTTPAERNIISGNGGQGLDISNPGTNTNFVEGNYIGTDVTGTLPLANQFSGVDISNGAQSNQIGGTTPAERNIVSGNGSLAGGGIGVHDLGTNNNFIEGNYVGTDVTGTLAVGNVFDGIAIFNNAQGNTVSGNLTSGNNWSGIAVSGAGTNGNIIVGNKVGTDATGMLALGNKLHGIVLFSGASNNTVNGNVASGNGTSNVYHGITISGLGTDNNTVIGNFAGTNATGTAALGNVGCGVKIAFSPSGNTIGGTTPAERNIISGNAANGVIIKTAANNFVTGNYIGLNASGSASLGNQATNVVLYNGATNNQIGGTTPGERNIIAGSVTGSGVRIHDPGTTGNVVEGNYIGTDPTGTSFAGFGNAVQGIDVYNGAAGNTIGGTAPGAGNLVAGNGQNGIRVADVGTSANNVWGNLVGTNSGGTPLSNAQNGILIGVGASGNFIGGTTAGQGNTIAYNTGAGVLIFTLGSNPVRGNSIYSNGALGINYTIPSGGVPVFTSAGTVGYNYQISGTLTATASTTYAIDFYASAVGDPSGSGQGQNYVGTATVTTDAAGNASFGPVTFPIVGWTPSSERDGNRRQRQRRYLQVFGGRYRDPAEPANQRVRWRLGIRGVPGTHIDRAAANRLNGRASDA